METVPFPMCALSTCAKEQAPSEVDRVLQEHEYELNDALKPLDIEFKYVSSKSHYEKEARPTTLIATNDYHLRVYGVLVGTMHFDFYQFGDKITVTKSLERVTWF